MGPAVHAAWLQATNVPTRRWVAGEDPTDAMRPGDVVVTVTTDGPFQGSWQHGIRPVTLTPSATVAPSRTPRGRLVLHASVILDGDRLAIDAEFGSRAAGPRWLSPVNTVLRTLRANPLAR